MAMMDPISDLGTDTANVAHLPDEEGGENSSQATTLTDLAAYVTGEYSRAKAARAPQEEAWLQQYRNYRGVYGPETAFTETEKSRAFLKVTKTKVLAAYAQISEVLFAGGGFPVGYEESKYPLGVAPEVNYDPDRITDKLLEEKMPGVDYKIPRKYSRPEIETELGPLKEQLSPVAADLVLGDEAGPKGAIFEPAREAALLMQDKVSDQLSETDADKHLRMVVFEMCLFGSGVMKGPFSEVKEYPKWDSEGEYTPLSETVPRIECRSLWNIYPDPEARTTGELTYIVDRHRLSRTGLRKLKTRPFFRAEAIERAVEFGPAYQEESWETILQDSNGETPANRFEVLEFWGTVQADMLEEYDIELPDGIEPDEDVQVNIWMVNDVIIRVVVNPFTPKSIPYHFVPFEMNPYSIWGIGVAENMEDTQLLMNGFMRMAVDNAALSGNLIIEVDETNLVPGQDMSVYPGKIFRRQSGAPGQAIFGTKFPNVSNELLQMFDKARQLSDESTGMPSFAHGSTGVTGVGRTASGMSMLMGAAATSIKSVVRNIDDYLLVPLANAFFAFNMQFNFDEQFSKGDIKPVARGTESLLRNEVRSQRLLQFLQMTANPVMQAFVRYDYILRELATSLDLDEDKIVNDPRQATVQAKMLQEIAGLMPQPPGGQPPPGAGPGVSDPTGTGAGTIAPGNAPQPGAQGFTGGGGGANGGQPPPQPQGAPT